jgi:hypothetical protein
MFSCPYYMEYVYFIKFIVYFVLFNDHDTVTSLGRMKNDILYTAFDIFFASATSYTYIYLRYLLYLLRHSKIS